jgi:LAS superfamily LD-carboxypeptidase LdcB
MGWLFLAMVGVLGVLLIPRRALGYVRGVAVELDLVDVGGVDSAGEPIRLEESAAADFEAMRASAAREGVVLRLNSGFRSNEKQTYLWEGFTAKLPGFNLAAKPGYSNHQSGRAADFANCATTDTREHRWLTANAHRWRWRNTGMSFTAQKEPWHWEHD